MLFLEILRWSMAAVLSIDGILFLWVTFLSAHDMKKNPQKYAEDATADGRLSYKQLLLLFGSAGVACITIAILCAL